MTEAYRLGFLTKLAEEAQNAKVDWARYAGLYDNPRLRDFSDIDVSKYGPLRRNDGGGFIERNPWVAKFLTNQLNGRFGNGMRAITYTHRF
jgi:hypothetical protein